MDKSRKIKEVYVEFCKAEGNQHIASKFAIQKIQKLIDHFKVKNVLEVGLGIGAIAGSLVSANAHLNYIGTERNEFCLKALKANLGKNYKKVKVFAELSLVPQRKFDLIIIDGKDPDLEKIQQIVTGHGIITIEGDRMPQQKLLRMYFPGHKYVHSISIKKNPIYSPFPYNHWQGGLKIIFVKPNFFQKGWWSKEILSTKLKYIYRKLS